MQFLTKHFPEAVPAMDTAERRKLLFSVRSFFTSQWPSVASCSGLHCECAVLPWHADHPLAAVGPHACGPSHHQPRLPTPTAAAALPSLQVFKIVKEWQSLPRAELAAKRVRAKPMACSEFVDWLADPVGPGDGPKDHMPATPEKPESSEG